MPAAFSHTIVTGMLRDDLGFGGLIISDDVGVAKQVADRSPGQRAVDFVAAGGDIVLTVDAGQAGEMTAALLAKARADPAFKRQVDAAALRVLQAKQAARIVRLMRRGRTLATLFAALLRGGAGAGARRQPRAGVRHRPAALRLESDRSATSTASTATLRAGCPATGSPCCAACATRGSQRPSKHFPGLGRVRGNTDDRSCSGTRSEAGISCA